MISSVFSFFKSSNSAKSSSKMSSEPRDRPSTVVVELFTSQGCSSCPPADRVAARILQDDPDVIVLSFHVDYWDYLGWKDPFSAAFATKRQRDYAGYQSKSSVYTPEAVVNGVVGMVGSQEAKVRKAISSAKENSLYSSVSISTTTTEDGKLNIRIVSDGNLRESKTGFWGTYTDKTTADVILVRHLSKPQHTSVPRGENGGSRLEDVNVVTDIKRIGVWSPTEDSEIAVDVPSKVSSGTENFVIIVQVQNFGPIIGASSITWN